MGGRVREAWRKSVFDCLFDRTLPSFREHVRITLLVHLAHTSGYDTYAYVSDRW